ncbi:MAG TPA: 50S ribosomal protein L25/general stress protein Ctc [Streptosporangiaceae bacterium]|nr:50S ribosomal protein L25/general stress protein Ctc [Streptosporangiaceae bacterium]
MPEVRIDAEPRTEFGKGPSRRVRRAGKVPAVLYGHHSEPRHVTLPGHEVLMALRTPNVLIRLEGLPGGAQLALPKAVQRHAIQGWVEHVDLLLVRRGEKVTVDVPVTLTGEIAPGGLLDQQLVQVSVEAEATHIPAGIEVNVEGMDVGAAVHAGDLELPRGVTLAEEPEVLVLHVIAAPTAEQLEAELGLPEVAAEAAPAEAEAGAEAAPAGAEGGAEEAGAAESGESA